eukprot:CAMPEP_0201591548 /NCGR_PEP_ID=MMETSP0190_2-20130828/189700_1 /ASSEMBLY_ACC=CAM_ASM_000263 /TAXON_ID=37353 /ORGANISM="Rosalina sp." /LENGTH=376 /DNA_ID=CAMNT_0048049939 /DNA_START=130 /DNA_END=1260 /DNA_ORIENTATION=+
MFCVISTVFLSLLIPSTFGGGCGFQGWEIEPQCGDIPPVSSQSLMVSNDDDLWLILGFKECFNIGICDNEFYPFDTIYKYDTKDNEWEAISVNNPSNVPAPRAFAAVGINEKDEEIIVFGGANYDNFFSSPVFYDDLWKYSIDDNEWTQFTPTNPADGPGQLSLTGLVANEDYAYVFGGFSLFNGFAGNNDLFQYEFATNTWTNLNPANPPPGRGVFGMEWSQKDDDIFYIYGGEFNGGVDLHRDLWEYDISSNTWTEITPTTPQVPSAANYGAFAVTKKDDFFVAFGETNDPSTVCLTNSFVNQAHSLSTTTYVFDDDKWEILETTTFSPQLKRPAYSYNAKRKNIYVYGGVDIRCDPAHQGVDVYNRNMYMFDV